MQKLAMKLIVAGAACLAASGLVVVNEAWAGTLVSPGCLAGGDPATVMAVDDALNLRLADGRLVRLAGIHSEEGAATGPASVRTNLESWLRGTTVTVLPLQPEPDRWNRTVALVFAPTVGHADTTVSVAEALLDAGLATAEPEAALEACWPSYLQLEDAARRSRSGLWAAGLAVLDPDDHTSIARKVGAWTLLAGRVVSVRDGRARLYVRFGDAQAGAVAVAIDHATERRLARTMGAADTWVGRRLEVRGLLDDRWGLQIDVSSPQQIGFATP